MTVTLETIFVFVLAFAILFWCVMVLLLLASIDETLSDISMKMGHPGSKGKHHD